MIGRAASLLVELPVDLQPSGWRFTDRRGCDARRAASLWTEDLDELAAAYDGYAGPLKVQVAGPWTLAASIELRPGERAVTDEGAAREIVESLAEGLRRHVSDVRRLVPGADVILQVDEPSLTAVPRAPCRRPPASGRCVPSTVRSSPPGCAPCSPRTTGPRWCTPAILGRRFRCCATFLPAPCGGSHRGNGRSVESLAATLEAGVDPCRVPAHHRSRGFRAGCGPRHTGGDGASRSRPAVARPHHRHPRADWPDSHSGGPGRSSSGGRHRPRTQRGRARVTRSSTIPWQAKYVAPAVIWGSSFCS